jgi:WD40 repeat protein
LYTLTGHTDFVKSLAYVPSLGILLSASTDASLRVWKATAGEKPTLLHSLKGHSRAIEDIAVETTLGNEVTVYTASSDRTIRQWKISLEDATEIGEPLIIHETSVYAIKVDQDDIWTCIALVWQADVGSADKTAKRYDRTDGSQETFQHPDFVKDVVVQGSFLYTACSDENIRQWSLEVTFNNRI